MIVAIGNEPNPLMPRTTPGSADDARGQHRGRRRDAADLDAGVFAGGDIVLGAATVILAMGEGRRAARRDREVPAGRRLDRSTRARGVGPVDGCEFG